MRLLAVLPALLVAIHSSALLAQEDNPDNAIHAITTLHEDGTKTVTITDPDKHTSEASTYDGGNRLTQKIIYALDDNNQVTSGVVYTSDNRPVYKSAYKRDDMNRVTEEDDYTMDDQLLRRFIYEFGPDGKVIRIRAFDSQGNELQPSNVHKDRRQSLPRTH